MWEMKKLEDVKALVIDLDGCLYVGNTPIPGAPLAVKRLRSMGVRLIFLTNNSTLTRERYREKLAAMGVEVSVDEILTSGVVAARYISRKSPRAKVLPVAEEGFTQEAENLGLIMLTPDRWREAEYVVVGLDRKLTYEKLAKASQAITAGAHFVATNLDNVYPSEEGFLPGAGSIASMITTATGVKPYSVGKPAKEIAMQALEAVGASSEQTVFVGDRVDTDVMAAKAVGCRSVLVRTGAFKMFENRANEADLVLDSIADLPAAISPR